MNPRLFASLLASALFAAQAQAQRDFSNTTIKVIEVAAGIYMLEGAGGNIGLSVGSDGTFMVDDQFSGLTPKIKAAIATVTSKPVKFLLNTHWHGDHTGGNEYMTGEGAIIVAQENVRRRMSTEQFTEAFNQKTPPSPNAALPVVTFATSLTFHINADSISAVHVARAHTDGDVLVIFKSANVMHMGDIFFNGAYPFIDVSSGGSARGLLEAVNRALAMTNARTRFIPGHGPLAGRKDLISYQEMVRTVTARVGRLVAQRRTLAQVLAAQPSAEYDAKWGKGFIKPEQFIAILYSSLTESGRK